MYTTSLNHEFSEVLKCFFYHYAICKSLIKNLNNTTPLIIKKQRQIKYLPCLGRKSLDIKLCSKTSLRLKDDIMFFCPHQKPNLKRFMFYVYDYFACIHAWCPWRSEEYVGFLNLQFWMTVSHDMLVLGTKSRFSARTVSALHYCPIDPAPQISICFFKNFIAWGLQCISFMHFPCLCKVLMFFTTSYFLCEKP